MELITNPKSEYLPDASLEAMHAESRGWMNEIDFWIEEMAFFYNLIHQREPHIFFPTAGRADLERKLVSLSSDHLSKVKIEIESHERILAAMVKNISLEEELEYREGHSILLEEMHKLHEAVRKFKKSVFSFVS